MQSAQRTSRSEGTCGRSSRVSLAESTKRSAMSTNIRRPVAVNVQLVSPIGETLFFLFSFHIAVCFPLGAFASALVSNAYSTPLGDYKEN